MRRLLRSAPWPLATLLLAGAIAGGASAQDAPAPEAPAAVESRPEGVPPPFLTLDQDRLFEQSAWGRDALRRAEAATADLAAENRRIEDSLEKEERDLTARRAGMKVAEFAALAEEFDTRVEGIRAAQDAKSRAISRRLDDDRKRFFEVVTPLLGQLLSETGAAAILADGAIVMSLSSIDITDRAIERVDLVLPPQDGAPQPEAPAVP